MKYLLISIFTVISVLNAHAQNTREAVQNRSQIQQGKNHLERDSWEINDMKTRLNSYNGSDADLISAFAGDFEREIVQTQAKISQSGREVRQSNRELRSERREVRDDRNQLQSGGPGNRRDAANLRNDRRDRRDDRGDRRDDAIDKNRLEVLLTNQQGMLTELRNSPSRQVVERFIASMAKDLELTRVELSEDRVEGGEDRRERREDRRERRERVY